MLATFINVALVLAGSAAGLLFRNLISQRLMSILTHALGLCVLGIGVSNMLGTQNTLCVIVCMVVGAVLGNAADIERRLEGAGDLIRGKLLKGEGNSRFTEGFVNAALLFCVGAMAITGSIEAGLNHNYEIIISKGVIDGVTAISFAAAMGVGVAFSAIPLLIYQGGITLLAGVIRPYLSEAVISQMSFIGSILIFALGFNLVFGKKVKVGNLLPAMFLPILFDLLARWWPWFASIYG